MPRRLRGLIVAAAVGFAVLLGGRVIARRFLFPSQECPRVTWAAAAVQTQPEWSRREGSRRLGLEPAPCRLVHLVELFAQTLYFFCPLLVSVTLSAIVYKYDLLRVWKVPIDGRRTFKGKQLFGDSKTWREVAVAVFGSVVTVAVQKHVLFAAAAPIAVVDYARVHPLVFGGVMGAAAMAGELPNSFVKRRLGIAPGKTSRTPALRAVFWVWDQVDLLTLSWPALLPWVRPSGALVAASFVLTLAIHPLVAWIGFVIGARKTAR